MVITKGVTCDSSSHLDRGRHHRVITVSQGLRRPKEKGEQPVRTYTTSTRLAKWVQLWCPQSITTVASKIPVIDRRMMEMYELENYQNVTVTQSEHMLLGKGPTWLRITDITPSAKCRKTSTPVRVWHNCVIAPWEICLGWLIRKFLFSNISHFSTSFLSAKY